MKYLFIIILLVFPIHLYGLTDQETLTSTLIMEAGGEGEKGMIAVANVIVNRYNSDKRYINISEVCLKKYQFSCWLKPWDMQRIKAHKQFNYANNLAALIVSKSKVPNLIKNSEHYCRVDCYPKWRDDSKAIATIGNHVFFRL